MRRLFHDPPALLPRILSGFVLAAIIAAYFWKNDCTPGFDIDEYSLLNIPYRIVTFGDSQYPAVFSDGFNSQAYRKYPPPMALELRNTFHRLFGFSSQLSRTFSGVLILSMVALVVWVALPRCGCGPWWRLAVLVLIGLNPSIITAARSVRFEHEIAFLGILGAVILPLVLYSGGFVRLRYLLWMVSGLCCSWAACSHPWGGVFPVVLLIHLTWFRSDWRAADGLSLFARMILLGVGATPPVTATILPMLLDAENYREYVRAMREHYSYPFDFKIWWSVFRSNSFQYDERYLLRRVFNYLYLFQAATAGAYLIYRLWKPRTVATARLLLPWCAIGFVLFSSYFVPVHIYYLYTTLLFPATFVLVAANVHARACSDEAKRPRRMSQLLTLAVVVGVVTTLHFSSQHLLRLANRIQRDEIVTVDDVYTTVERMSERLGISGNGGPVYTDMVSWIGAGRNARSLIDTCVYLLDAPPPNQKIAGVIYERRIHEERLRLTRGMHPLVPDPSRRLRKFKNLLPALEPTGFVIDRRGQMDFQFHRAAEVLPSQPGLVAVLDGGAATRWFALADEVARPILTPDGVRFSGIAAGTFLVSLRGTYEANETISVVEEALGRNATVKSWQVSEFQETIPCVAVVEIPKGSGTISLVASSGKAVIKPENVHLRRLVAER